MSSLSIREKIKFAIESQTKQYIKQNFTLIVPIQFIFFVFSYMNLAIWFRFQRYCYQFHCKCHQQQTLVLIVSTFMQAATASKLQI